MAKNVALKSYQSFAVSDGLLQKVVEAVKAGEKEARTSGVQSFEVFYRGQRQNICIGRIYVVPPSVCSDPKNFPVALLYGTVVRELNLGEEVANLISKKLGDSEFDEYSTADFQTIKDTFFKDEDGKYTSLIVFAPSWANIRDYVFFKFTDDDAKLENLLRHLVFACYFDPALSSAFNALMTNVDTTKWDAADITPKIQYPLISANPLKQYPELEKVAFVKKKAFLTRKNADELTKQELDPQELDVFESLDTALSNALMPETETAQEAAGEFKEPGAVSTPAKGDLNDPRLGEEGSYTEVMNKENEKTAGLGDAVSKLEYWHGQGEDGKYHWKVFRTYNLPGGMKLPSEEIVIEGEASSPGDARAHIRQYLDQHGKSKDASSKKAVDQSATTCKDCGKGLDAFKTCPDVSVQDAKRGLQFCGKGSPESLSLKPDFFRASAAGDGTESRNTPPYGEKGSYTEEMNEENEKTAAKTKKASDAFFRAYVQAALWSSNDESTPQGGEPFDKNYDMNDIAPDTLKQMKADCDKFQRENGELIRDCVRGSGEYSVEEQAGHDFWLTRNGHGAGFWDGDWPETGDALTAAAKKFGEYDLYLGDDGKVHGSGGYTPVQASKKTASLNADLISSLLTEDFTDEYDARSHRASTSVSKNEQKLDAYRKRAGLKVADVPMTEESIWNDITEEFGEAPQVALPGESSNGGTETKSPTFEKKTEEPKVETHSESKSEESKEKVTEVPKEEKKPEEPKEESKTGATYHEPHKFEARKSPDAHSCKVCGRKKDHKLHKEQKKASENCKDNKSATDVSGDIAEAQAEVVSPDTVDSEIKQPTESVEEAASKSAASGDDQDEEVPVINADLLADFGVTN